ncbi:hypothetical protein [Streptomyces brevispora]|uniref:hypothetical protein n=1 Tax=Streptomyces brevispora TaxID=887462 RepID=UPI0035DFAB8B
MSACRSAGANSPKVSKGFAHHTSSGSDRWSVPYLPIDPADVGGRGALRGGPGRVRPRGVGGGGAVRGEPGA